ncbi:MAG: PAS domain S-box protein, partial [Coprothermobacterota bacterium]|nr:PAS domain S-box protein [Coprothermobacterota bacterium]
GVSLTFEDFAPAPIEPHHFLTVKFPMRDATGRVEAVGGISVDITERKRAEEALRESEEKFKAIANYTVNWESWFGPDGRYLWVNPAVESFTGYSAEEILAMPDFVSTVIAAEDRDLFITNFQEALCGNKGENFEFRYLQKNGAKHWLSVSWQPIFDVKGNFLGVRASGRDITDRKQAEEAIRISEASLAEAQRMAHLGSWELNLITGQAVWSDELCRLFEISAETIGKGSSQLRAAIEERIHPDDLARYREAVDQSLHQKIPYDIEYRIRLPDGAQRAIHAQGVPTFDPAGNLVRLAGTAMDITERKQAEDALRTSEASYRLVVENANEAILVAQDGMLKFVNRMAIELTGYSEQELTSRPFPEFIHPDDRGMVVERHLSRLEGDTSLPRYAFRLIERDGSTKWVEIDALLIEWEGRPATLNFLSEITARKQAEKQLTQSHDLLANLARLVPGVVYQYRLYPDGRSAFPYSSPGMNDIYEVTPEEVREDATPVFGRLHPDDYDRVSDSIQESARTLQELYCEFRVILPRQGLRWRWSQAHPERMADGGALWHGIISDITERKQAEDALRESEERYRNVSRLSSDFAYSCIDAGDGEYQVDWITDAFY